MYSSLIEKLIIKKLSHLIRLLFSIIVSVPLIAHAEPPVKDFPQSLPSLPATLSASGETSTPEYVIIKSSDQATFSSETAASVANIPMKEGSSFRIGDILLELDCRLQRAELKKALAEQTAADMSQTAAKKLQSYGSISKFEVVKATADADIARAEVDKLRATVDKCVIKAPFNGSIAEIMVHSHETVKPGDPLLKIVNTENLEFEMQVPSCWLQWLHIGSDFSVHINEVNKTISAKITKINPQIEPVSQSVKMVAEIIPANPALLPGMSGQAIFPANFTKNCTSGKS
ncbi:MAG: efflux RND transporter periplasmic adaptor subunit [Gammaproteobacteria bacterium]